ncbi:MAG TPA: fumarylacetoacetate hydrolase family protein [Candidatus Acidoferrum sp.]|nr:fumarylacetoacetate hydrolase family protein [Candidatus Acidoferrum sp.]
MKLLNFYFSTNDVHLGLIEDGQVIDLTAARPGRPEFTSVTKWLRGADGVRRETETLRDEWRSAGRKGITLDTIRHAPLVGRGSRIFCVGLNYADHAKENNLPPPAAPIFFSKLSSVVIPHETAIPLPAASSMVDYEAEMAFLLGKRADRVSEKEAAGCIAGYTIMNDVTARDLQREDKQWFRSKNCNGFGPMGPWLVTADEIADPANLEIALRLNGQVRQHSNTRQLVFPPGALVSRLSQTLTLEPGDVISTGTPAGIGAKQNPPAYLKDGDRVEIEVAGIGVLRNFVGNGREA